ncbi:MAG TPA: YdcF family protein [Bryobacteraceae bacterium]|nr:YdcF family protein [Bryobacteraceae bacterium]
MKPRSRRLWPWLALAAIALALVFHAAILGAFGSYLVRQDPPHHADAIFVLAGDASGHRILTAARMVREGYALKAIVSGPPMYGIHESDLAIALAVKAGYSPAFFQAFEHDAHSTREEAHAAAALLHKLPAHSVILVTSDYHTRRAGNVFRAEIPDIQFDVVAAPDPNFSAHGWWKNREGRKTFAMEWIKTVTGWFGM